MEPKSKENLIAKPPVVVILGHIDHGKSSILQSIKDFKITEKEAGGITQHIGAYEVEHQGKKITLIDTPGHEAFSAMRSRGAKIADIAVLVIAADEGIKPQTKEAILNIKKSGLPMIVALNKIDRTSADPERVKGQLLKEEVKVESMGGEIPCVNVSAKTSKGLNELLDLILLVAEMEDIKCSSAGLGQGAVIESCLDSKRGPIATLILSEGQLNQGQFIATGSCLGKIKQLFDFQEKPIKFALPSQPVIILGFTQCPKVGEKFKVFLSSDQAKSFLGEPQKKEISAVLEVKEGQKVLNLVIKTDVLGSAEAIDKVIRQLPQEKVILRLLKKEVGEIKEDDVKLAKTGQALILGFRVKVNHIAKKIAEKEKIRINNYEVIYDLVEGLRKTMEKIQKPEILRTDLGKMKALVIFRTEKSRQIVGGKIIEGEVKKGVKIEVFRQEEKIGQGKLVGLQKNKKDIDRAGKGEEAGILYEGETRVEEGDILVFYVLSSGKS